MSCLDVGSTLLSTGTRASSEAGSSKITQCCYREKATERETSHFPNRHAQEGLQHLPFRRQHQGLVPGSSRDTLEMHGIVGIGVHAGITATPAHHAAVKQR